MIIRHSRTGAPHLLARHFDWSVINAVMALMGTATQGLLDMLTMRDHLGDLRGKTVAIVGDVRHSRVARSITLAPKLGAKVVIARARYDVRPQLYNWS